MLKTIVLLLTVSLIEADLWYPGMYYKPAKKQWALLVASSNGWYNYRHQADICHAYHVLRANGIPAENIITMTFDDIAYNEKNPTPGVIQNRPGGPNVYEGFVKDYTGKNVTVQNLYNILSGNKEAMKGIGSGRVIESGPDDNIFVNLVDHGSTGVLLFPNHEYLHAKDFLEVLSNMKKERRFSKMVIYLEACEGGSLFDNKIDDSMDVFVVTASAPDENSFAYYCENGNCFGDLFSIAWMEQIDKMRESGSDRYVSLFKQYRHVRTNVNKSHVMVYGDFRLGFERLSEFVGEQTPITYNYKLPMGHSSEHTTFKAGFQDSTAIMSRDVPLHYLQKQMEKSKTKAEKYAAAKKLVQLQQKRHMIDNTFELLISKLAETDSKRYIDLKYSRKSVSEDNFECYKDILEKFNTLCLNSHKNPYVLRHFYILANICYFRISHNAVESAFREVCRENHKYTMDTF